MELQLPPFDELLTLARERPNELERLRRQLCQRAIDQAPEATRPRLRALQSRIELELRRHRHPLARCVRLSALMHASVAQLARVLNEGMELPRSIPRTATGACVLPFPAGGSRRCRR
ncbi:MAG TPA: DUF3135 domain-containing protein [Candidatus Competibacteraceae bacterium]|nr:DUF3135 domain-containing protein [Candidatus Competibacteraceae bacterium]